MANLEIEKRFLCKDNIIKSLKKDKINYTISNLEQFYLIATKQETLRYRKENDNYIKNMKRGSGLVREEIEKEVSKKEYKTTKRKNSGGVIKKRRYKFFIDGILYELDIFRGKLKGLCILEVEFKDIYKANEYSIPKYLNKFIIKEITQENIYSNGALSKSMKIPLRKDSFLTLNEIINSKSYKKPIFKLYISDYENSRFAIENTIQMLIYTFKIMYQKFLNSSNIYYLKKANKALNIIKVIIKWHKKYIIKNSKAYEILFNINYLTLHFKEIISLDKSFNLLLSKKGSFKRKYQTIILIELIKIAQKKRILKDKLLHTNLSRSIQYLEKNFELIDFKDIDKPFYYIGNKILINIKQKINKDIKDFELIKEFIILSKYFNTNIKIEKEYKKLKKIYKFNNCSSIIEDKYLKKECKITLKKKVFKKIEAKINGN